MDKIDIKDIQGNLRFSTIINKEGKRRFYLMKEDYITLKFSVDDPVYFQLGDYAEYDNELFEIVDLVYPSLNKSTGGYDYELRLIGNGNIKSSSMTGKETKRRHGT